MYTVADVVAALRDCETIHASPFLSVDEKITLVEQVLVSLPDASFSPNGTLVRLVCDAVRRHKPDDTEHGRTHPVSVHAPKKQGRKATGVQKSTEVAAQETSGN